ncbi:MAG: hypothetical protein KGL53_12765, partial [Elusimicrobia bacterium]|nr:hypothetical protein [Elusimicrobiota bacterium]
MGSAAGSFVLPAGRLLGDWSLTADAPDGERSYSGRAGVPVEEYKRPEFEVTVDASSGAWRYGTPAPVSGKASYYFGGPVPGAAVSYTVTRRMWLPWWCWWWRGRSGGDEEVLRGTAKTGPDGTFRFSFIPRPADPDVKDPAPSRFAVKVEARDAGGRTIEAQRTFTAGAQGALLRLDPEAGFATAGRPFSVGVSLLSLDETPLSGSARFRLVRLDSAPAPAPDAAGWGGQFPEPPPLEESYAGVPDGPQAGAGTLRLEADGEAKAALGRLAPGAYRLEVTAADPSGASVERDVVVLAVDPGRAAALPLDGVTLPEHASYEAGRTARVLLGSSRVDAATTVEVWGGAFLLSRRTLRGKGPHLFTFPVDARCEGGVTVRWFGVKDYRVRGGQVSLAVPRRDKLLTARLSGAEELEPGQRAAWKLTARDARGRAVDGEAALRMYDRSLEYYAKGLGPDLASLYPDRPAPEPGVGSERELPASEVRVETGVVAAMLAAFEQAVAEPLPPSLRLSRARIPMEGFRMMSLAGAGAGGAADELRGAAVP